MLEQEAGRKAHRTFAASSEIETAFHRSMIRNKARGSSGHSYGSPTLWFVWLLFTWSRRLGLLPRIVRRSRSSVRIARIARDSHPHAASGRLAQREVPAERPAVAEQG
jgi:hypothetical protein